MENKEKKDADFDKEIDKIIDKAIVDDIREIKTENKSSEEDISSKDSEVNYEKDTKEDNKKSEKSNSNDEEDNKKTAPGIDEIEKNLRKLKDVLKKKIGSEQGKRRPDGKYGNKTPSGNNNSGGFDWKKNSRTIIVWLGIVLVALVAMNYMDEDSKAKEFKSINEFNQYFDEIAAIEITNIEGNAEIKGEFKTEIDFPIGNRTKLFKNFILTYPSVTIETAKEWENKGIIVKFSRETYGLSNFLISMVPWILILFLWIYLLRRMQGGGQSGSGGRGIFSFGKSKAKLIDETNNKIKFKDVAGVKEAKEELEEIIDFLSKPERYHEIGAKIPKGVLLTGPPGTGKTLLAKAVAGEAGVPFFNMSGADFVEMFVGVGASRVRDLFENGRKAAPCIIFIDELDAVGRHRGTGIGGGNDEREQTLNQLLVEMDGFESDSSVIVIAATNRPDVLDPALLRPGRFDRQVVVDRPDVKAREQILEVHAKNIKLKKETKLGDVAKGTPGMSGADLANIINESALLAARKGKKEVELSDIEDAKDKVMMGVERKSAVINDKEKEMTAYHEAGHVLVAKFTEDNDPVHKVTIIPRGRAMGLTHYLPGEERHSYSKKYITGKLIHLFGGRVAEEIIFGDISTGASNDIERATDLARKMVCEWGMSEEIGPIHYGAKNEDPFLGRQLTRTTSISEEIGKKIDTAVQSIIFDALERTKVIIKDNVDLLHILAKELIVKETLSGEEIDILLGFERKTDKKEDEESNEESSDIKGKSTKSKSDDDDLTPLVDPLPEVTEKKELDLEFNDTEEGEEKKPKNKDEIKKNKTKKKSKEEIPSDIIPESMTSKKL